MNSIKVIGIVLSLIFGCNNWGVSQIQLSVEGNVVASGSVNTFDVSPYNTTQCLLIEIKNTSSVEKNYTIIREKIINPSSWTSVKSTWELPGSISAYCYPGSADVTWTTFNSILTQSSETVQFDDCYQVSNDSCALYRYYINSAENGIEDSLDIMYCGFAVAVGLNENSEMSLSVYPNPTNGIVHIENSVEIESIEVYDLNGALKLAEIVQGLSSAISMDEFPAGMYLLSVHTVNGMVLRKRIHLVR